MDVPPKALGSRPAPGSGLPEHSWRAQLLARAADRLGMRFEEALLSPSLFALRPPTLPRRVTFDTQCVSFGFEENSVAQVCPAEFAEPSGHLRAETAGSAEVDDGRDRVATRRFVGASDPPQRAAAELDRSKRLVAPLRALSERSRFRHRRHHERTHPDVAIHGHSVATGYAS